MPKEKLKFPEGFLWGAATSAHQVEGNNTNSDWWAWEHSPRRVNFLKSRGKNPADYQSGIACDSYNKFEEDFALAEHLGHNAHRLGIEWARIEPKEGVFSEKELDHYEKVLRSAKYHGLKTFVTLHHFTNPIWFAKKGGFARAGGVNNFFDYAKTAVKRLDEYVDFWLTFNEPELYSTGSYSPAIPRRYGFFAKLTVAKNIIKAHNLTANYIRHQLKKPVSMAFHLSDLQPWGVFGDLATSLAHYFVNEYFLRRTINQCDYIGVNYYFHHHIGLFGRRKHSHSRHEQSDMGFGIHPEGLERVLLYLKKYGKPIYITENGIADGADTKRLKFIKDHLYFIRQAMLKGADVRGYLHWSLLDNFEWGYGFGPKFGLVEVDREGLFKRKARYSALKYAEICRSNCIEN